MEKSSLRVMYLNMSGVLNSNSGYFKKINQQVKALRDLGVDVEQVSIEMLGFSSLQGPGLWKTLSRRKRLLEFAEERIVNREIDLIYMRYSCADGLLYRFVKKYGHVIVTEHQTLEEQELASMGLYLRYLSERYFGRKVLKRIAGIVGVTEEICLYEKERARIENIACLPNGNGIDIASVRERKIEQKAFDTLEMLCVAHVAKWHGLDRLIKGMAEYQGNVRPQLHIVGDGSEIPNLKRLVTYLKLENSVIFHGFKTGKELDELFDRCHVAVGSLAIHRAGSGSPLKSKEYCARGIPFVDSVNDADFDYNLPFRLKLTSDDTPIDIEALVSFTRNALSDSSQAEKMRCYAQERLDWSIKMKRLKDFFEEIAKS